MPLDYILSLLIAERDKLSRAIEALQGPVRRRGRPPKATIAANPDRATSPKPHGRKFTAAQRRQQGERMKAYWAAKRKKKS